MNNSRYTPPKPRLCWNGGRAFSRRVQVTSYNRERHLFYAPAALAFKMCVAGVAEVPADSTGEIDHILLVRSAPPPRSDSTPITLRSYQGQRYIYLEQLGNPEAWDGLETFAFRYLPRSDLRTLRQALDDCFRVKNL